MRKALTIILVFALGFGLLAFLYYNRGLGDITQPPPETLATAAQQAAPVSHIGLPISISFTELARYANQKIPEVLVQEREHKRYKKRALGISFTIKGRLTSLVKRTGPVTVGRHEDLLELQVPLFFEARFKGSDVLDPDVKSKGRVQLKLRFELGMTPDWQPTLKVYPSYRWLGKPKLKLGPLRLDAREILGEALEERLEELARDLEKDVRESAGLQDKAAARWHELHQVRQLGDGDTPAWLVVDPQAAYFAPVSFSDDAMHLQFALALKLTTLVGQVQPPPVAEALPALNIGPPPATGFRLQLPVSLNYAGLGRELRERHAGRELQIEQGSVTPQDFKLYSSGTNLVLGAHLQARAPQRLFNSRGWVYLQGRPVYDPANQRLSVEDFNFTRQLDNWLVSGATWLLQDSLRHELASALHYDLSEQIAAAKASVNTRINRPINDGFHMQGSLDALQLGSIQPRAEDLLLLLDATGQLAISTRIHAPTALEGPGGAD